MCIITITCRSILNKCDHITESIPDRYVFIQTYPDPFRTHSGPIRKPIPDRGPVRKNLVPPAAGSLPGVTFSGDQPPAARCAGTKFNKKIMGSTRFDADTFGPFRTPPDRSGPIRTSPSVRTHSELVRIYSESIIDHVYHHDYV